MLHYIIRFLAGDNLPSELVETIGYTSDPNQFDRYNVVIIPSGFFDEQTYGTPGSLPQLPLKEVHGIPLLFGSPKEEWVGDTWVVHADIIASTYFLISRYEEIMRRDLRDEHGRFPGKASLPYRAGFIDRPIVDENRLLLHGWLRQTRLHVPEIKRKIKRIYLTHDVDAPTLYRSWKGFVRSLLNKRGLLKSIQGKFGKLDEDPFYTFPWIFYQNNRMLQSAGQKRCQPILFIKGGGKASQDKPHYDLRDKDIRTLIKSALEHNITIGLHSSYQAGADPSLIQKEKRWLERNIRKSVRFNRHHFLRGREPEDMDQLEAADLTDDFTMGYADIAGFRLGTCYPVRWINPITRRLSPLILHPLIAMDRTLESPKYMGLDYEQALAYCRDLINKVREVGGELVLLWHNDAVREDSSGYQRKLYAQIMSDLSQSISSHLIKST